MKDLKKEKSECVKPIVAHGIGIIVMKRVSEELESLKEVKP